MPFNQQDHGEGSAASLRLPHHECHHRDDRFLRRQSPARRSRSEISDPPRRRLGARNRVALFLGRPLTAADKPT
jgi:hypothetical protein